MKPFITVAASIVFLSTPVLAGQNTNPLASRINSAITTVLYQNPTATDTYGTPYVIKWSRQGDIASLRQSAQHAKDGSFLQTRDNHGNNVFHVAKNAETVQMLASLIRQFYGDKAPAQIAFLVNQRNRAGETTLHAQINAGHTDTFRPLYGRSHLRELNKQSRQQLTRLRGAKPAIFAQNNRILCTAVYKEASANGITLKQSAQAQIPYNPEMAHLAQALERMMPCLAQN